MAELGGQRSGSLLQGFRAKGWKILSPVAASLPDGLPRIPTSWNSHPCVVCSVSVLGLVCRTNRQWQNNVMSFLTLNYWRHWGFYLGHFFLSFSDYLLWGKSAAVSWAASEGGPHGEELRTPDNGPIIELGSESFSPNQVFRWLKPWLTAWL